MKRAPSLITAAILIGLSANAGAQARNCLTHPEASPVERVIDVTPGEVVVLDVTMSLGVDDAGKDAR